MLKHLLVYLFYENAGGEKFGFTLKHYAQILRCIAAEALGKPKKADWRSWRDQPDRAELDDLLINETIQKIRSNL